MINTLSKINLSKIGWEGGRSTSIWIMSLNILGFFFESTPYQPDFDPTLNLGSWEYLDRCLRFVIVG